MVNIAKDAAEVGPRCRDMQRIDSPQGSISFGDNSQKTAAAAAAAQKAMQEQELAELVSLGFDEADAKVRGCLHPYDAPLRLRCKPALRNHQQMGHVDDAGSHTQTHGESTCEGLAVRTVVAT